ncbi:class D beta-lactamase [Flavobacterium algicola]|uniref:class D beta-lactamase n=1 Tax=Flavobacterium algicola TaxID=556529 RepID=UPI001EFCDAE7|nr:class D beta-lactamase [Flavobacterium algicola]MCG9792940.1 class D beta-lactamase [Flavobacterium algicola]
MRKIALLLNLLLLVNFSANCQIKNLKPSEIKKSEFGNVLDSLKVTGAILIYDVGNKKYYSNDFAWTKTGIIPASTFKIPNSIIALETGIIKSDSTVFKWDGEKRRFKKWEEDLTFKEAFQVSCVPCYQEIARKIGVKRMKSYLKKLNYNGMVVDTLTIDDFWLQGKSKFSQMQQIDFLERLYYSKLPISKRTENIMKDIMQIEKTENYVLSGKSGWGMRGEINNGWLVGYLETNNSVYFFATNIEKQNTTMDEFPAIRLSATKEAFIKLKIIN